MKCINLVLVGFAIVLFAAQASALTPDAMMSVAIHSGSASGELTGDLANEIKAMTRSTAATRGEIVRLSIEPDKCHIFKFTVTQPDVPNVKGEIVGDYVTVTKTKVCPDDRKTPPPEVIDCRIGKVSCMPAAKATHP